MAAATSQSTVWRIQTGNDKPGTTMTIPIIRNVITNEELPKIGGLEILPSSSKGANLAKIYKLLNDKHSKNLVERHAKVINKLPRIYDFGVHLKDVKIFLDIIEKCHEYLNLGNRIYEELLCKLVNLFSKPFFKSKVSDEEKFLQEVSESINKLGLIAEASSDKVKVAVATSISTLYISQSKAQNHQFSDCKPVSKVFIKSIIDKSKVCKSIAECMGQSSDYENRYVLMKSLNHLADSSVNCNHMLKADVVSCICNNLLVGMYNHLFVGIELLWNILDNGDQDEVARQLASTTCLNSLQSVFINQMSQNTSYAARQLRNDILTIISLIASKYPSAPFVECGFTKTLAMYSTYPELPTNNTKINQIKITPGPEDFELKKLFLNLIAVLSNNSLSVDVLSSHHVIYCLLSYVIPIKDAKDLYWTVAEFEELQLQAMAVLSIFAPLSIMEYMNGQGNARLLAMLDWCVWTDEFSGRGNSFYGVGGQGNKRAQMRLCIRVLRNVCATRNQVVCQDLTDQGLIHQLVAILTSCSNSLESNDLVDIEIQRDMLFILATLCEDDMHRKSLFGEEGVKMTLQYLEGYVNFRKDPLHHHHLVLSTIDCISSAIIGCYINEVDFLKREGAFMLLDLLDMCPENMKNIVMVAIADLLENEKAIPHLMMWHGKNEKTAAKALLNIWTEEEKNLGVRREAYGVIADASKPLVTSSQEQHNIVPLPSNYETPAVVDVSDNMRSKIYGIFCKIGFYNIPGLNSSDYITLSLIERYLDFKTLEIWQEIEIELKLEKVEPIHFDRECIQEIILILQNKALTVTVLQKALIESNFEQAILDEIGFYEKIKETYKQKEKSYQDFCNYIDRTSDYSVLQNSKKEQLKLIDCSRLSAKRYSNGKVLMHQTMDRSLHTTTFCGRHLFVESMKSNEHVDDDVDKIKAGSK